MYMLNSVIRSSIFNEFTPEEQEYWFSIKEKAVSHHIDSLYYSVFIEHDKVTKEDTAYSEVLYSGLGNLLLDLNTNLQSVVEHPGLEVKFHDLLVCKNGAAVANGLYGYHLSCGGGSESDYDIFISKYLPNDDTPRIQVQLRTRSLVLDGLFAAIENSFEKVIEILSAYNLSVERVQENRIDYAFHTNVIQSPAVAFSDGKLSKHMVTSFREYMKHAWITKKAFGFFDLDYFALGSRRANNVFFRAYDKTKEVVQKNYKAFFFEMWRDRGLISEYDKYVYSRAYKLGSYKTGCLVGRIEWYLEFGKNAELKAELRKLLESCHIGSDNNPFMEKSIKGVLPPTTVVLNFEFETKRKFYLNNSVFFHGPARDMKEYYLKFEERIKLPFRTALEPLYRILKYRREIIEQLTSERLCFVEDNQAIEFKVCDFWERLRRVRIDDQPDKSKLELYRTYSQNLHGQLVARNLMSNVSSFSMFKRNSVEDASFGEDMWDVLTSLNDNDLKDEESMFKAVLQGMHVDGYVDIRKRRARQLKHIVEKKKAEEEKTMEITVSSETPEPIKIVTRMKYGVCSECGDSMPVDDFVIFFGEVNKKIKGLCPDCARKLREEKKKRSD